MERFAGLLLRPKSVSPSYRLARWSQELVAYLGQNIWGETLVRFRAATLASSGPAQRCALPVYRSIRTRFRRIGPRTGSRSAPDGGSRSNSAWNTASPRSGIHCLGPAPVIYAHGCSRRARRRTGRAVSWPAGCSLRSHRRTCRPSRRRGRRAPVLPRRSFAGPRRFADHDRRAQSPGRRHGAAISVDGRAGLHHLRRHRLVSEDRGAARPRDFSAAGGRPYSAAGRARSAGQRIAQTHIWWTPADPAPLPGGGALSQRARPHSQIMRSARRRSR